jgi:hypothetical protein
MHVLAVHATTPKPVSCLLPRHNFPRPPRIKLEIPYQPQATKTMRDEATASAENPSTSKIPGRSVEKPSLHSSNSANDSTTTSPNTASPAMDCTKSDATTFPLMKLPPELRLKVYRHHFEDFMCSEITGCTTWDDDHWISLSLLRSSSQVRRETALIFYKECMPNKVFRSTHDWVLVGHPTQLQDRVEALSQLLAQYNADVETCTLYIYMGDSVSQSKSSAVVS